MHHGSISKELREFAESRLAASAPCKAVCSNTLELGIDVGRIDGVVQVTAPPSVSSLAQRIGRSGRGENEPGKLRAFLSAVRQNQPKNIWEELHLGFIHGVAATELMLDGFAEPLECDRLHGSTLVQQILSCIAETGGCSANKLYEQLCVSGCFGAFSANQIALLLRGLGSADMVEQLPTGELVIGIAGEKLVGHYSFYAAFKAAEEFAVFFGGQRIGALHANALPAVGDHFILAGRRWRVLSIDFDRRELLVEVAVGRKPPWFALPTAVEVHRKVHETMHDLLVGRKDLSYLDMTAKEILAEARTAAARCNGFIPRVQGAGPETNVFLWGGSKINRTIHLLLADVLGPTTYKSDANQGIGLKLTATLETVCDAFHRIQEFPPDKISIARIAEAHPEFLIQFEEKYDNLLPPEIRWATFVHEHLDLPGAMEVIDEVIQSLALA